MGESCTRRYLKNLAFDQATHQNPEMQLVTLGNAVTTMMLDRLGFVNQQLHFMPLQQLPQGNHLLEHPLWDTLPVAGEPMRGAIAFMSSGESLMPRADDEFDILPSVLDRLLDDEPGVSHEPLSARFFGLRQLTQAVARDLEALLNTRQEALEELPAEFAEVGHSLRTYGVPDFTALSLTNPQDRQHIRRTIEQAIAVFEPRLDRVRVTVETPQQYDQALRFRVEALLRMEPAPIPVAFDAALLKTQEIKVQGTD